MVLCCRANTMSLRRSNMLSVEVRIHSTKKLEGCETMGTCRDLNPYLQVWVSPKVPKKCSDVQFGASRSPMWNWRISDLEVDVNHMFEETASLHIDVYHRGSALGTLLGYTTIPLTFEFNEGRDGAGKTVHRLLYLKSGEERGSVALSIAIYKKNPQDLKPFGVAFAAGYLQTKQGIPVWKQCSNNVDHLRYVNALVQSHKNTVSEGLRNQKILTRKKSGTRGIEEKAFFVYNNRICNEVGFRDDTEA
uniref:C2 domain-containing protein n=1 Tax=Physcomitrium patens TaxID=3218 RepID=A0A2K1IS58_PHYPA|nr:hypothetical protein PHYPA_026229 [Physcomitrium patens]